MSQWVSRTRVGHNSQKCVKTPRLSISLLLSDVPKTALCKRELFCLRAEVCRIGPATYGDLDWECGGSAVDDATEQQEGDLALSQRGTRARMGSKSR